MTAPPGDVVEVGPPGARARIPLLGFGTWQLRGDVAQEGVRHALELGVRHIDTARMYENEREVGAGLAASGVPREDIFLTTKIWREDLQPDAVRRSVEGSLADLDTDYVDLLLIHWPGDAPLGATLEAMRGLQEQGKARHIGVSNFTTALMREALAHAPIVCNQVEYHPYLDQDAVRGLCREHGVAMAAYSPLAKSITAEDDELAAIGAAHGKTGPQVALRWLLQQGVIALPRSSDPGRRRENTEVGDFALTDDEMARVTARREAAGRRLISPDFAPAWD